MCVRVAVGGGDTVPVITMGVGGPQVMAVAAPADKAQAAVALGTPTLVGKPDVIIAVGDGGAVVVGIGVLVAVAIAVGVAVGVGVAVDAGVGAAVGSGVSDGGTMI